MFEQNIPSKSLLTLCFMVFCVLICAGCATISLAEREQDLQAKRFMADQNKATIYIYRIKKGIAGVGALSEIRKDGKIIGRIVPGTFLQIIVDPGKYVIGTERFAPNEYGLGKKLLLEIKVEKGGIYFL